MKAVNSRPNRWGAWAVAAALSLGALWPSVTPAFSPSEGGSSSPSVSLQTLPPEARETHRLILSGGPFPYQKDGTVFGNREGLLPRKPRGHYREYTVRTPGSRDRGARRIVCGGEPPEKPEVCFYTADHYASFSRIAP